MCDDGIAVSIHIGQVRGHGFDIHRHTPSEWDDQEF